MVECSALAMTFIPPPLRLEGRCGRGDGKNVGAGDHGGGREMLSAEHDFQEL